MRNYGFVPPDRQLVEILSLPGLPSQNEYGHSVPIDIEQLLRIRETTEGKAFRAWFQSAGAAAIEEMSERWNSLTMKLATATHGLVGRGLRFAVSTAAGMIPSAGLALGRLGRDRADLVPRRGALTTVRLKADTTTQAEVTPTRLVG